MSLFFFRSLYFLILFTPLVSSNLSYSFEFDYDWKRRPEEKQFRLGVQGATKDPLGSGGNTLVGDQGAKPLGAPGFEHF